MTMQPSKKLSKVLSFLFMMMRIFLLCILFDHNISTPANGVTPTAFMYHSGKSGPRQRNDQPTKKSLQADLSNPHLAQNILLDVTEKLQQPILHFLPSISTASRPPPPLPLTDNPYVIMGLPDPYSLLVNGNDEPIPFPSVNEIKRVYHRLVRYYHPDAPPAYYSSMMYEKSREEREEDLEKLNEAYHKLISSGGKYDASKVDKENVVVHHKPARRMRRNNGHPPSNCTALWRVKDIPEFLLRKTSKKKKCESLVLIPAVVENNRFGQEEKWDPSQILDDILRFDKIDLNNGHVNEHNDFSNILLIQDYIKRRSEKNHVVSTPI